MNAPLYINAVGMACPLGLTAASAAAAMRAGIERKRELPYRTNAGHPIMGSFLPELGEGIMSIQDRCVSLLALALKDLQREMEIEHFTEDNLILALPREMSDFCPDFLSQLAFELGSLPKPQKIIFEGSQGGYRGLSLARQMLEGGLCSKVIVAGVDSLISALRLLSLDRGHRLLTEENSDGVVPGEAAAAVSVSLQPQPSKGVIRGMGFGQEPSSFSNDVPLRGIGIVEAAKGALVDANLKMHHIDARVTDAAGESYHFKEQILVMSRLLRRNKETFPTWYGALTLGDVGAAAGLCNLVAVIQAYQRDYFPGRLAIAFAGSDDGYRSAIILDQSR